MKCPDPHRKRLFANTPNSNVDGDSIFSRNVFARNLKQYPGMHRFFYKLTPTAIPNPMK